MWDSFSAWLYDGYNLLWGILAVIVIIIVGLVLILRPSKCPKCGKRKWRQVSKKELHTERISIKKKEEIKHYSKENTTLWGTPRMGGSTPVETVTVREYTVPGIKVHYEVTKECLTCGEQIIYRTSEQFET